MKSISIKEIATNVAYFLASMAILLGLWHLISVITKAEIPNPASTWIVFKELVADPFYDYGPNDKGIGIQLLSSLGRVSTGFALGSLIAIPMGLLMGSTQIGMKLLNQHMDMQNQELYL